MKPIIIISGPSGSGKDSIIQGLLKKVPTLVEIPTYTTRLARNKETEGKDHFFISKERFNKLYKSGEILEKNFFDGAWYGASKSALEKAQKSEQIPIMEINVNGFLALKKQFPNIFGIYIWTDEKYLSKRIKERGELNKQQIDQRINQSRTENEQKSLFDYVTENKQGQLDKTIQNILTYLKQNYII